MNKNAATSQRRRTNRKVHGGEQHEPLRNHADHGRNGENEGLAPVSPVSASNAILRVERQNHNREQHHRDDLQNPVDRHLNFRDRAREGARLLGQALRVDTLTHRRGDHPARTRDDARTRQQLIALLFLDGARLAGQQRLVDLETRRRQHCAVNAHLVAERQIDDIIEDNVPSGHHRERTVAQNRRLRSIDDSEGIEGALRTQLGNDTDHGIDDHDAAENAVAQVSEEQNDDRRCDDDRVEQRQHILTDNRGHRPRGAVLHAVDSAARNTLGHLSGAQAALIDVHVLNGHRRSPHPWRYAPARQRL